MFSPLITQLITNLRCLPGVGPKSAQRMAFQLLERNRDSGLLLAKILERALAKSATASSVTRSVKLSVAHYVLI